MSSPSSADEQHPISLPATSPTKIPLSPITLWPIGTIPSTHVLPGRLDLKRFERAVTSVAELYPVVGGRLSWDGKEGGDWWIDLTEPASLPLSLSTSSSLSTFPTLSIIQPSLDPYIPSLDPTQLNAPASEPLGALLSFKITFLPSHAGGEKTALGITWGHVLGDGNAFLEFTRALGRAYERDGAGVEEGGGEGKPNFGPHVALIETPGEELLRKWKTGILWPSFSLEAGWRKYTASANETEVVQLVLSHEEIKLLKSLASGPGENEWVSEQDAMSSYFVNLLRLCGEEVESVCNSVNYRTFFPSHPSFPSTLPNLVANVAQMYSTPLAPTNTLSLCPIALAIRTSLTSLRSDSKMALEWLSCRAYRMQQAAERREMQVMVPSGGECIVNSNWRYDWNVPFGFDPSQTSHHTAFSIKNFLRVFRTNPGAEVQGAEWTFNVRRGLRERVLGEVERDRKEGWGRWK